MCTVTIIPKGNTDFVLTSNRDEAPDRETLEPDFYMEQETTMLYPKDKLAGGTWIGVSENHRLVCLLNGGFTRYERQQTYRMSRGIVVKDLLATSDAVTLIHNYDLNNIEPFTIVIADWNKSLKFYELVWDGNQKHFQELPLEPKIWSSSTLYTQAMKAERNNWFQNFKEQKELHAKTLMAFHKTAHNQNKDYGVVMDRGFVKTTSITQVEKTHDKVQMTFTNLQTQKTASSTFLFSECAHD